MTADFGQIDQKTKRPKYVMNWKLKNCTICNHYWAWEGEKTLKDIIMFNVQKFAKSSPYF